MKVLITGVAGFIGSHLADLFLSKGHEVIGVDSLITGKIENISHIKSSKFTFVKADISKDPFEPSERVDGVLNLASPASPKYFDKIPIYIMDANSIGTKRCLEIARKHKARFLMASTSEIYGEPKVHPQNEEYHGNVNPIGPRAVYDESKRFAEAMIYAYYRKYDVDVRVARIFNTYGPRMRWDDGRVIPTFVYKALKGEPLTIFGDGTQTRCFCYISDQVEGLYRLFMSSYKFPVNIGSTKEYSILELVNVLKEIMKKPLKVEYHPLPKDDPTRRKPDITLAKKVLNWEPKVDLKEGLKRTIEWFSENI